MGWRDVWPARGLGVGLLAAALLGWGGRAGAGEVFRVAAVGDILLGSTYPADLLPPGDAVGALDPVRPALGESHLVFGNLEGPLVDGGTPAKCAKPPTGRCFEFRMPVRYARRLADAGFNVLNLANNHARDFGAEGVASTVTALAAQGIQAVGGERVARLDVGGRGVRVLGFSASPASADSHSLLDLARARELVSAAGAGGDLVIVSFHGGAEGKDATHVTDAEETYAGERRGNVVAFARAVVEAGADLVLGHGPHVPRAVELYQGRLVAYSLGNFAGYGRLNTQGPSGRGLVLRADLDLATGAFLRATLVSVDLSDTGLPVPDPEGRAARLARELTDQDLAGGGLSFSDAGDLTPAGGR